MYNYTTVDELCPLVDEWCSFSYHYRTHISRYPLPCRKWGKS